MKFFNAKFNTTNVESLSDNTNKFRLTGDIIDNTASFTAMSAEVGDIIYLDGSSVDDLILRYKITEITSQTNLQLVAIVQWDMDGNAVEPPLVEGIIGAKIDNSKLSMITNVFTNGSNELLVSAARSYEQSLLVKETGASIKATESKIKIPTLGYSLVQQ